MINKSSITSVILLLVLVGGYFIFSASPVKAPPIDTSSSPSIATSTDAVVVTYTDAGFSPNPLTVKVGTTVTFVNKGTQEMWVGSDPHPAHTGYDSTSRKQHCPDTAGAVFDQCVRGNSFTFTFKKIGTWPYHNHILEDDRGTVIVTP